MKKPYFLIPLFLLIVGVSVWSWKTAFGGQDSTDVPVVTRDTYREYDFFATSTPSADGNFATSTTATSTNINPFFVSATGRRDNGQFIMAGAKKVTFFFTRGDKTGQGNTGSTRFRVQVSPNGTDWYYFEKFLNATSSIADANNLLDSSLTITAATNTIIASMDLDDSTFYSARCIVVEATDGEHSCKAVANW